MIGIKTYDDVEQALGLTKLCRALPLGMRAALWCNASPEVRKNLDCVLLPEAVKITGIGTATLTCWVTSGRIGSTAWKGQTIVRLSEIKKALDNPAKRGRPVQVRADFTKW